ncbi:MAG: AAA-like domain-containing protein [Cyanobacteria bacterium P01_A01_bin.116]
MEFPCGALSLTSSLYIERPPVESYCYQNLETAGSLTRIKGPRHTGKSSLLVRLLDRAQQLNYQTVVVDFQAAEEAVYSDLSRFLRWFCTAVAHQLSLPANLNEYWDDETGAKLSATIYFEEYLLEDAKTPIVLALNEVNRVFQHPDIARDFLPLLRFWYEQAKQGPPPAKLATDPTAPSQRGNDCYERGEVGFQKLRTVVVHSTDVYVPLNIHQSPFNVGLPVALVPFNESQSQELAKRYGVAFDQPQEYQALKALVGGHPYLLSVAFYYLRQGQLPLNQLLAEAPTPAGIYHHHLQACLETLQGQSSLLEGLHQTVMSPVPIEVDAAIAHQLHSLGLVTLEGNTCRPACELYRLFFAQHGFKATVQAEAAIEQPVQPANLSAGRAADLRTHQSINQQANQQAAQQHNQQFLQQLQAENEQLKALASLDGLTQLSNRRIFDEQLQKVWKTAIRQQSMMSLIILDIDFFKLYNDTYGHIAGDFCLKQVAGVLRERIGRPSDTVARYGGEEFAIILPGTDAKAAAQIAVQLRDSIQKLNITHAASKLPSKIITCSMGVASVVPKQHQRAVNLVSAADAALYVSKHQGRDRLTLSNAPINQPPINQPPINQPPINQPPIHCPLPRVS